MHDLPLIVYLFFFSSRRRHTRSGGDWSSDVCSSDLCFCYRCDWGLTYGNCNLECAQALKKVIRQEGPEHVLAFIAEPVVGAALGAVPAVPEYFPLIREICDEFDVLFIADEVMTGFGRTGANFGMDHWHVVPDIISTAKGISGGYTPLAAAVLP